MKKGIREEVFKHPPAMGLGKKMVLSLPIILSLSWIFYLKSNQLAYVNGAELLSPANSTPLMVALMIFTIGYIIFLLLMFSENIKEFFSKKVKD